MLKKICFVTTISGTLKSFVIPTAKMLHEKLGVDITFICDYDDSFNCILPDYIKYIPISMKRGIDIKGIYSIWRLYRIFKENKFDIVQYSTPNAAMYASMAARMAGVPIRLYGQWGIRYVGFKGIRRKLFKVIEKFTCLNSTHVRSVSQLNRQFGINEGLYGKSKVKVVGNGGTIGVDLSLYDINNKNNWRREIRGLYGIADNDFVFCFCGRISSDKGSCELLQAFRNLLQTNQNIHLMLIGGEEMNHGIGLDLLEWTHNCKNVHLCGRIDGKEITHYYSAVDTLVHPSYREGFGMVIQEAGAMGVPVITTRIPGAGEVMVDEESCLLVKPRDVEQLEAAMHRLVQQPDLTHTLGRNAYERTKKLYDRETMLKFQCDDYTNLLQSSKDIDKIILAEVDLWSYNMPKGVEIVKISGKNIKDYNNDDKVIAVVGSRALSKIVIDLNLPSLKLYQLTSAGFDNVPCVKYAERGVMVANAGTTYSIPISETVVFGILQFAKRLRHNPNNRNFKIRRRYNLITELAGKRVIILGAGNIGTSIATRLNAFGIAIDGYDPFCSTKPEYNRILRTREELKRELYQYDYIISTLPDTTATKEFVNTQLLNEFKPDAVFVNVGRKTSYKEDDLYSALKHKQIGGAILDIFQEIPNPFTNKFRRLNNVIVWPGLSAISCEVKERLNEHILKNLLALLRGENVSNIINRTKC